MAYDNNHGKVTSPVLAAADFNVIQTNDQNTLDEIAAAKVKAMGLLLEDSGPMRQWFLTVPALCAAPYVAGNDLYVHRSGVFSEILPSTDHPGGQRFSNSIR